MYTNVPKRNIKNMLRLYTSKTLPNTIKLNMEKMILKVVLVKKDSIRL